jgi:glycosyl transferase, family 25
MRAFVINLKRSADRRLRMKGILDGIGVEFEFFVGADGKELGNAEIEAAYDEAAVVKNLRRTLSANEIGCTISHRSLYRKIVDEGIDKACILEDDVILDRELPDILAYLDSIRLQNVVVKLDNYQEKRTPCGIWTRKRIIGPYRYKKPVTTQWMAWGYVIDREAAASILREWPRIAFMSDDWKRMSKAIDLRCVQPSVVHQNTSVASILDEDRKELLERTYRPKRGGRPGIGRLGHIAKTIARMAVS